LEAQKIRGSLPKGVLVHKLRAKWKGEECDTPQAGKWRKVLVENGVSGGGGNKSNAWGAPGGEIQRRLRREKNTQMGQMLSVAH